MREIKKSGEKSGGEIFFISSIATILLHATVYR